MELFSSLFVATELLDGSHKSERKEKISQSFLSLCSRSLSLSSLFRSLVCLECVSGCCVFTLHRSKHAVIHRYGDRSMCHC